MDRILCIAAPASSPLIGDPVMRLYYSDDYFRTPAKPVTFDLGRDARDFLGLGAQSSFLVAALKAQSKGLDHAHRPTVLYISLDGATWTRARFPHSVGPESGYTVLALHEKSLVVDVFQELSTGEKTGSIYTSSSDGTTFVQTLNHTYQNKYGIVDYEHLSNIQGVMMANVLAEPGVSKKQASRISWDEGSTWGPIRLDLSNAPGVKCNVKEPEQCSLHLHSVTKMHNTGRVFSSLAPGFVMGVGNAGNRLEPYQKSSTWLSTDAGRTWKALSTSPHKYEFGDQGSVLVLAPDDGPTSHLKYSWDFGESWSELPLGATVQVKFLTTVPDNTAQKFLLMGTVDKKQAVGGKTVASIFVDFATVGKRACGDNDLEKWYVNPPSGDSCILGHKQWYRRRKPDADCVVGHKFTDPVGHEDACSCRKSDYECDFGFVRSERGECVPSGDASLVPPGACQPGAAKDYFMASSGYRLIAGNTCKGGIKLDEPKKTLCKDVPAPPPQIGVSRTELPAPIADALWMPDSPNVLLLLQDNAIHWSQNEGATWELVEGPEKTNNGFLRMIANPYERKRAYLVSSGTWVKYTVDGGNSWGLFRAPLVPNTIGVPILDFHPDHPNWLIWTGMKDCDTASSACHAEAHLSTDHGSRWTMLDTYVQTCSFLRDTKLHVAEKTIVCEVFARSEGRQTRPAPGNMLKVVHGEDLYNKKSTIFEDALAFATFDEFMVVAQFARETMDLRLMVSLNGEHWAQTRFPPGMTLDHSAYTALDSSTGAIFLHVTTEAGPGREMGSLVKSNWNGTYFTMSIDNVNRNRLGYVDFEKMVDLNGIAVVNTVTNPSEALVSGQKHLGTRITHNDGARWEPLQAPAKDSGGQAYPCQDDKCSLHLHGYSERDEPGVLYSSPSAKGQMVGVGNVGTKLLPYAESDTFFTRDAGFTWSEVRKGAHRWEFGDHGSIIVLVNDEEPTDRIVYTLDEGMHWHEHVFGAPLKVQHILTGPYDRRRRFVLLGAQPYASAHTTAVHLDFSPLQQRQCKHASGAADDFETWSPSEKREEKCLFGQQRYYWRRKMRADCYVGEQPLEGTKDGSMTNTCECTRDDFECEYNHVRNEAGNCVLVEGTEPLVNDPAGQCATPGGDGYWYERTAYRKVPMSKCEGGQRLDRGEGHSCGASLSGHGLFWWLSILVLPLLCGAVLAYYWTHSQRVRRIHLPEGPWLERGLDRRDWTAGQTLASVPYWLAGAVGEALFFVQGLVGEAASKAASFLESVPALGTRIRRARGSRGSYGGYRHVSTDDDAEILRVEYDDED